jgi:AcrR family transcriptional regulator
MKTDLRRTRSARYRLTILGACSRLMQEGEWQPSFSQVARQAGVSLATVYKHFTPEELRREAAADPETRRSILRRVLGEEQIELPEPVCERLAQAVVLGAPFP